MTRRREPRRINRAGRAVWFVRGTDARDTVRPVTREGVVATVLALLLILGSGAVMLVGVALTHSVLWIPGVFVVVAAGLVAFGLVVSRHLP